jgi:hypothetical protein
VLARLIREGDPPDQRAALHFRVAQILRTQSEYAPALAALEKALEFSRSIGIFKCCAVSWRWRCEITERRARPLRRDSR